MEKIRIICLLLCAYLLLQPMLLPASALEDSSVVNGSHSADATIPLAGSEKMLDSAKAVFLYERNGDTLMYAYQPDQRIDPSSMAKLMTALIALERGDLSATLTVSRQALSHVGVGVASIKPRLSIDEEASLESLIYCAIAASDNDSCAVIAEHIAGGQIEFVAMMNERARELGCTDTNFANAHGLYDQNAYTTARDICKILDAALENEKFQEIFQTKTYTVPATNKNDARQILTTNYMMSKDYTSRYFDARVTGGKTGTDGTGGRCLAVTAETGGMELLAIVMGAEPVYNEEDPNILEIFGSFEEMKILLDFAEENYEYRQVFYKNQTFSQYPVAGGANDVVTTPVKAVSTVLPLDLTENSLRWVIAEPEGTLKAPVEKGQKISYVQVWYGEFCIAQTDLVAMNAVEAYEAPVEPAVLSKQEEDSGGASIAIVFGIILGAVVLIVGIMFAVMAIRNAALRTKRRRRRKNRRKR